MVIEATKEQAAARDVFASGRDLALVAGAGTGKTTALILMGASTRQRGLYVAFNKAIADDAKRRFGANVACRTGHSLAFRAVGRLYSERLNNGARIPAKQTARILGITRDLTVNSHRITINHQARLVMEMVRRFCHSSDRQVMARHLEWLNALDTAGQEYVARVLTPYAVKAWDDISSLQGRLRFEHDHYMKLWAMGSPVLEAEYVLLDEAQDTNPVMEEVFLTQGAQRVCVGDPAQQIYAWRSARDVMTGFPAEHLWLTQSFRFGPAIAELANRWLRHAESDMRLSGCAPNPSSVTTLDEPDAVLCRGNADAMDEILKFLKRGVPVALTGGGGALHRIAEAAQELKAGKRTSHPELFLFSTWDEVQEYVEYDQAGQDLKAIVKLIDAHGPEQIIKAVGRLSAEEHAKVTVSTAHKAKGREWRTVRIGHGFTEPSVDENGVQRRLQPAEARLIYVAVTRAREALDPEGVEWIDAYEAATESDPGSVAGRPMIDLPLTAQLRHTASPMSRFMESHLPNSDAVRRDYLTRVASLPHPVQPIDVRYPDWSALGHAIDYRIRLSFGGDLGIAVRDGVLALDSPLPLPGAPARAASRALREAGDELLATVDSYLVDPRVCDEETLARLCFVASFYEDISRTGQIRRRSLLAEATAYTGLGHLADAVPSYVIGDIASQTQLAEKPLAPFRSLPDASRICGPTFAGSGDIGGADADYILDGLLLDCKATKEPRRLGRDEFYQLAGYVLLDYDDAFAIDKVGLYLSRQGGLITWDLGEFLAQLGAREPLDRLRATFRQRLREERARNAECDASTSSDKDPSVSARRLAAELLCGLGPEELRWPS